VAEELPPRDRRTKLRLEIDPIQQLTSQLLGEGYDPVAAQGLGAVHGGVGIA
jgi:hypothetical protein